MMRKRQRKKNHKKFVKALLSYFKDYWKIVGLSTRRDVERQFTNAKYNAMVERLSIEDEQIRRVLTRANEKLINDGMTLSNSASDGTGED
jgi:Sec7-like guanine-nucleotide exchange factor